MVSFKSEMKQKDIDGKTITNAIGYCHCKLHEGALNGWHIRKHKCRGKHCKWFELYPGVKLKDGYVNKRRKRK